MRRRLEGRERLETVEKGYLGGQSVEEFLELGGDIDEYAAQVFGGEIFGLDDDPKSDDCGIETAADLAEALRALVAMRQEGR